MKAARGIVGIVLLGVLQFAASRYARLFDVFPDLLLIAAIFFALRLPRGWAWTTAWLLGLLKALGSAGPLGVDAFGFVLVALGAARIHRVVYTGHPAVQFLLVWPLAFGADLLYGVQRLAAGSPLSAAQIAGHAPRAALYTALAAPFVFFLLAKLVGTTPRPVPLRASGDG